MDIKKNIEKILQEVLSEQSREAQPPKDQDEKPEDKRLKKTI